MQTTHCDICNEVIKSGEDKFILAIHPIKQGLGRNNLQDIQEAVQNPQKNPRKIQIFEIDNGCKKVIQYLFTIRIKKLKELKQEIEKIGAQPNGENTKV